MEGCWMLMPVLGCSKFAPVSISNAVTNWIRESMEKGFCDGERLLFFMQIFFLFFNTFTRLWYTITVTNWYRYIINNPGKEGNPHNWLSKKQEQNYRTSLECMYSRVSWPFVENHSENLPTRFRNVIQKCDIGFKNVKKCFMITWTQITNWLHN